MSPLLAALLALGGVARAGDNSDQNCFVDEVIPSGSTRVFQQAATDNTNLYGALGVAERKVLPMLHKHEDMGMFIYEHHVLAGATKVPARAGGACEDSFLHAPVDLTSGSVGFAVSKQDFGIYYVASVTMAEAYGSGPTRFFLNYTVPFFSVYYGMAAPFTGALTESSDSGVYSVDYVAGVEYTPGTVAIRAAYVGSEGVYAQAAESRSGAFFGLAATERFVEIPYLRTGIERFGLDRLERRIGRSSLYGRKMELPALSERPEAQADRDFWSGHIAQEGIAEYFDVVGSFAVRPSPFLHELRLGVHTEAYSDLEEMPEEWGYRAYAGVASVPPAADLGVVGGPKPSFTLEALYGLDSRGGYFRWDFALRYNDPDVLARFPYAENAFDIYVGFEGGGN